MTSIIEDHLNIVQNTNVCSLLYCFLEPNDWYNLSLVSKNTRSSFNLFMNIVFGDINTWSADCPECVHKWKCKYAKNGPFDESIPTKPFCYTKIQDSVLSTYYTNIKY